MSPKLVVSQQVNRIKKQPKFSCFIVGEGAIALECLQILLGAGHDILGVYSTDRLVRNWTAEQGIPQVVNQRSFSDLLLITQYDYLFSINNSWIIPEEIIARAAKATINYHDSPLPKYAGVYATSWALIHGETQHAITWHKVTAGIDTGDILKQVAVSIQSDDTALSLNVRCFEAAIKAFNELVHELSENREEIFTQDISQRSYFSLYKRPENACLLSFKQSTKVLYNLVRALDFGRITNPLGFPKIWLPGGVVCVSQARIVKHISDLSGQVLAIDKNGLEIATSDGSILFSHIMTLEGITLDSTILSEQYGVRVGLSLPDLSIEKSQYISQYNDTICRHEHHWVKRLTQIIPFIHPYLQVEKLTKNPARELHRYPIVLSSDRRLTSFVHKDDSLDRIDALSVLTIFATYCARISTESEFDLTLQTSASCSIAPEIFAQEVPIRIQIQDNESFSEFSTRFKVELQQVSKWGSYARDVMVRYPELRDCSSAEISVALILAVSPEDFKISSINSAISLIAYEDGSPPELINTGALNRTQSEAIIQQIQSLGTKCLQCPEQLIHLLPLLTETQSHQLLFDWNQTQVNYPKDKCIHQLFEEQVELNPDAISVVFEDQQLTYGELNTKANQLAHYLQDLGVQAETLVGICVERSLEMIIGMLGILKAGGAYVSLDPTYPQERLAFMLEDAAVTVLLTQSQLANRLPTHSAQIVYLDKDWKDIDQQSQENLTQNVKADNLAYIIYTSGSTGKPKGVLLEHQGLCNLAIAQQSLFNVQSESRVLQFASVSFDASVWEIFMALTSGATLVLSTQDAKMPGQPLLKLLHEQAITIVTLPPSALAVLPLERLPVLQTIIVAGEACPTHLVARWATGRQFFNAYGPTESTVCATVSFWSEDCEEILIGRPIANTQVYILDRHLQPVPVGIAGELHIGGDGLARGYLNRPDLTQEKFIPNLFSNEPDSRLYKTGDLARYLPDGNIEFLGRIDHQVKIRGFRIELGEIEAVLSQHPAIREAVVVVREDVPGDKRLIAYFVVRQVTVSSRELRDFLKQRLPEYMVPAAFLRLDSLPLSPNGKIDRRALPLPSLSSELQQSFLAAQTPSEKVLVQIWSDVLRLEQVGVRDNFFELGGDSILSIQIVARCNQAGLKLTPKDLFQHQTIAELAQVVNTTVKVQAEQGIVTGIVPLTAIQHWFLQQQLSEPHHFNQSFIFEVPPDLKSELLKQAIQYLLIHHDALRLRLIPVGDAWQQINVASEEAAFFDIVDLSKVTPGEQATAIAEVAAKLQASLNLLSGPILRATLFTLGANQPSRLLIIIHHLAVDGVSWRILLEDLAVAYQQLKRKERIVLPAKTTSFQDWAMRLTNYVCSEAELSYWLNQVDGKIVPLPIDFSSEEVTNAVEDSADILVSLSVDRTTALLKEVPSAYNTQINDVLLTALVESFVQWTGQRSLLLNLEGHGREDLFEDISLARTVGWFTAMFPVVLKLEPESPEKALKSIKEQLRQIPNHGIGYGILRYLSPDEKTRLKLQTLPQAEVCFNYLGQLDRMLTAFPLLGLAKESIGLGVSPKGDRSHLLEINGFVAEGKLQFTWTYNRKLHQKATVEHLAQSFMEALIALIAHCLLPEASGCTPSDFPDVELSQAELDDLMHSLNAES
jgi:amino acid adenylation domain-containing protein/non-ribosomal peptide synthase protein (TIGR01720 family)